VVDNIEDMAPALVRTIRNPAKAQAQAECGRQRVLERYDWSLLADKLEKVWIACATRKGPACFANRRHLRSDGPVRNK
jgi:glycosyltransferase involved in cell wall biosynthesis